MTSAGTAYIPPSPAFLSKATPPRSGVMWLWRVLLTTLLGASSAPKPHTAHSRPALPKGYKTKRRTGMDASGMVHTLATGTPGVHWDHRG